ncbi:g2793 [Coccomyxa viridis]|uniref:G2793 protein n=1 Tax=Coccomyxa viridis TaxID=1274662 RepID=A0ABP1FL91_9CHLO
MVLKEEMQRLTQQLANGLLEAKVDMMRDNLNAARADATAKAALEKEISALKEQLAGQSERSLSADRESAPERPASAEEGKRGSKSPAELEKELESLQQTNKLLTDQIRSLQAKADAARQEAETVTAENSQLGAHLQLLESELDSARHLHATDSTEGSPRQSQLLPETMPHGLTPQHLDLPEVSGNIPATDDASPAFSLNENPAYDREGGFGSPARDDTHDRDSSETPADAQGHGAGTDAATPQQSEADFRFSNLKRKWHAEEGKYLSNELRRAQDLTVQQEMELEALRQQLASFTSGTPQGNEAEEQLETMRAELQALQLELEHARGQASSSAELHAAVYLICIPADKWGTEGKAQVDEEVSRLKGELEAARADTNQQAGKATAAEQRLSQHNEELARLRQEHEAEKQRLQAEASATGSRLAAAEASLAEAHQQAAALQDAAVKHEGDSQQSVERLAALQAELEKAHSQVSELQSALTTSRADAEEAKFGSAKALPPLEDALQQAKQQASSQKEQVKALTEQLEKAGKLHREHTEALQARIKDLTGAVEEAQVTTKKRDRQVGEAQGALVIAQAQISGLEQRIQELTDAHKQGAVASEARSGDELAKLRQELEASRAEADGHQHALQELSAQAKETQELRQKAEQTAFELAQEKDELTAELARATAAHAEERNSLKEKAERLQKATKQRRQELAEMQEKSSALHQRASAYDQTFQELQQARSELEQLRQLAAEHGPLVEELAAARAQVRELEKQRSQYDSMASRAVTAIESRMASIAKERDLLQEQVAVNKSAAVANEAMQMQLGNLQRELAAAQAAASAAGDSQQRAQAAEKAAADARLEAQNALAAAAAMEERVQAAEEEMDSVAGAVEEERARRLAAARAYAEELDTLGDRPSSTWPASVRTLVKQRESAAAEASTVAAKKEAAATEAALESDLQEAKDAAQHAKAEQRKAEAARDAAQAHCEGVSRELAEREAHLEEQLQGARAEASAVAEAQMAAATQAQERLEGHLAVLRATAADWQTRAEAAEKEVAQVKEKAWRMMEEKDAELRASKAGKNHGATESRGTDSPLPLSHSASLSAPQLDSSAGPQEALSSPGEQRPNSHASAGAMDPAGAQHGAHSDVDNLQKRVEALEKELAESENTHRLRDTAQAVAKQEIAELRRQNKREGLDLTYLKNVILRGFESGELSTKSSMLPVLARLLEFSPAELGRAMNPKARV